ncbi:MAG: hypothetical protein SAL70_08950, partial [Scytonema sp. PMC 1070.18]|nr:hypothetical protein [Scytonema sp. PMC 1070.18]
MLAFSLLGFLVDLKNTFEYGGIDLRNRVVGARLLNRGMDPYYFKWSQGQDERLLDPLDKPYIPVSRVTVPPTVLLLHSTFANLPYFIQRVAWFLLQWGAFLTSLFILIANVKKGIEIKLLLMLGLLFVSSNFWRIHTDVGQI